MKNSADSIRIKRSRSGWRRRFRFMLRNLLLGFFRIFGTSFTDARTGESLGRAFVISFRGKVHVIGLFKDDAVCPTFLPQERITYWKQEMGFYKPKPVKYENIRDTDSSFGS